MSGLLLTARSTAVQCLVSTSLSIKRSRFLSPSTQPDNYKTYHCRPDLWPCRIFYPKSSRSTSSPLVIMAHGGGFMVNNPSVDDPLARQIADQCGSTVIAIDYRKAPQHCFPKAYEDVLQMCLLILEDDELFPGLNYNSVVLLGSSAGGNLVLAAAQDERLRGKVDAIVALYPLVDVKTPLAEKLSIRPDPSVADFLENTYPNMLKMYLGRSDELSLEDPRISPTCFRERHDLPQHLYFVGCQHDLLCSEARKMAERAAGDLFSQRVLNERGWEAGPVRWNEVEGQTHAFDHFAKSGSDEIKRLAARDLIYRDIFDWLRAIFHARD